VHHAYHLARRGGTRSLASEGVSHTPSGYDCTQSQDMAHGIMGSADAGAVKVRMHGPFSTEWTAYWRREGAHDCA